MNDISLKDLLEAGCHFGHKVERWHPKASKYIYQSRDGLHIIDLAQTREGLRRASQYLKKLGEENKVILFVATKRQAKGVVGEAAKSAGIAYLTNRWIGGFITNWEQVEKNINKLNTMRKEQVEGAWKKFPKHEQVALEKMLHKIEVVYTGVAELIKLPDAVFIIDVKKEIACYRECLKASIPMVAICDTNADPNHIEFPIPANDDAVGSIKYITEYLAASYAEGKKIAQKQADIVEKKKVKDEEDARKKLEDEKKEEVTTDNIKQITNNKEQEKNIEKKVEVKKSKSIKSKAPKNK